VKCLLVGGFGGVLGTFQGAEIGTMVAALGLVPAMILGGLAGATVALAAVSKCLDWLGDD
jgi:hypothetical protein